MTFRSERFKQHIRAKWKTKDAPLAPCCSKCGSTENLEHHHPDYSKPLEYVTLCRHCHRKIDGHK